MANDYAVSLQRIDRGDDIPTEIKAIYVTSFPPEEQRPWQSICRLTEETDSPFRFYLIRSGDRDVGLVTCWHLGAVLYIEHLAIDKSLRGAGLGSQTIALLRDFSKTPLLLEVEPEITGMMAKRRIGFYRRCGFDTIDYDYTQPPYDTKLPPVRLTLMSTASLPNIDRIVTELLHPTVYGVTNRI